MLETKFDERERAAFIQFVWSEQPHLQQLFEILAVLTLYTNLCSFVRQCFVLLGVGLVFPRLRPNLSVSSRFNSFIRLALIVDQMIISQSLIRAS